MSLTADLLPDVAPGFTGGMLDRADALRHDADALAAAQGDWRARLLALDGLLPALPGAACGCPLPVMRALPPSPVVRPMPPFSRRAPDVFLSCVATAARLPPPSATGPLPPANSTR